MYKSLVNRISCELCLDEEYLLGIINKADKLYKRYSIPKRNGKQRYIYQANKELKTLQYWIVENLLSLLSVSDCAFAYIKGKSIKKHANIHIKSKHILHTDIKNFFPSIKSEMLINILSKNEDVLLKNGLLFRDTYDVVSKLCFMKNRLCIGTVSSPVISNIVMYDIDAKIIEYCKNKNMIYTRYADDIYISSEEYIDTSVLEYLCILLIDNNFRINYKKTSFISDKSNIKVTGINIIDKERISIGSLNKKIIRKKIYNYIINNKGSKKEVLGYLAYLKDIEPKTFTKYNIKYMKYINTDLVSYIKNK